MTLLKTSQLIVTMLCVIVFSSAAPAQACPSAHAARAMIQKYGLKTVSQVKGQIPGQILNVKLCGSGLSAKYHIQYKETGKSGNKRRTIVIRAR